MRARWLVAAALLAAACEKTNGAYCDATTRCPNGASCDLVAHQCAGEGADMPMGMQELGAPDLAAADLTTTCGTCPADKPICQGILCVTCNAAASPDDACKAIDQTRPHCLTTGTDAGQCANCAASTDCSTAHKLICDPTLHVCRGCNANSECASEVCDTVFDPVVGSMIPPAFGGASIQHGDCADSSAVIYVDKANAACSTTNTGGTMAVPYCKIATAINNVGAKTIIHAAMSTYSEDLSVGNNTAFVLVGDPGSPGTVLNGMNNEDLRINGNGLTTVTVVGVDFQSSPSGRSAIWCQAGNLALYQSRVANAGYYGVDAGGCTSVVIDQCRIGPANAQGGVHVGTAGSTTSFSITNNFIFRNGGANSNFGGVQLAAATTVTPRAFVDNTIADNTSQNLYGGISCGSPGAFTVVDSILFANVGAGGASESNCTTRYTATDDHFDAISIGANNIDLSALASPVVAPGFVGEGANNYHLTGTSPCKGAGTNGLTDHDFDGDPRPAAGTTRYDIGADELP